MTVQVELLEKEHLVPHPHLSSLRSLYVQPIICGLCVINNKLRFSLYYYSYYYYYCC